MPKYSHRERIEMIIAGETPDRWAASFWRHFFHMEHHAEGLAEAMVWFQRELDWDFMKINPRADYHIEDWGFEHTFSRREFEKHKKHRFPISNPDDWLSIKALPLSAPALAEHLKAVSLIRKQVGKDLPLLMTVFTPLAIAGRMVPDRSMLVDHLRQHPDKLHAALRAITDTYARFAVELRNAGADGLFFATTHWATSETLTWEEYEAFGVPYDLQVMQALDDRAINLLHVCDPSAYLAELAARDYRCQLINWDTNDPTNPPLDRAADLVGTMVRVGGVDYRGWLIKSGPDEMKYALKDVFDRNDKSRVVIGPGCAVYPETPMENLRAIRELL